MDLIDRINFFKNEKNIKQNKIAEAIGIPESTVSNILNRKGGRKFSPEQVAKLAKFFNVSTDYLYGLEEDIKQKIIPLIGKSSCGKPRDYDLNGYEPVPVPLDIYSVGMYAVEAVGDSMIPKINDGDIVYCQPNQIIDNGRIVHYWLDGKSGIKKYKINEAGTIISLLPINSDYDIITIHCDERHDLRMAKVVGRIDKDF